MLCWRYCEGIAQPSKGNRRQGDSEIGTYGSVQNRNFWHHLGKRQPMKHIVVERRDRGDENLTLWERPLPSTQRRRSRGDPKPKESHPLSAAGNGPVDSPQL